MVVRKAAARGLAFLFGATCWIPAIASGADLGGASVVVAPSGIPPVVAPGAAPVATAAAPATVAPTTVAPTTVAPAAPPNAAAPTLASAGVKPPGTSLYIEDGQLTSHPLRLFVNQVVTPEMKPQLQLRGSHAFLPKDPAEDQLFDAQVVAPNQLTVQEIDGTKVQMSGTVLLFDVNRYPFAIGKPMARVQPVLSWNPEPGQKDPQPQRAVGSVVYLGRLWLALAYSVLFVAALVVMLSRWAHSAAKRSIRLLCDEDGRLSLARVQVAAWTVAIGTMVVLFGIIRYRFQGIPESLLLLMGMSAVTTGVGVSAAASIKEGAKKTANLAEADARVTLLEATMAESLVTEQEKAALAAESVAAHATVGTPAHATAVKLASEARAAANAARLSATAKLAAAQQADSEASSKRAAADVGDSADVATSAVAMQTTNEPHFRDLIVNKDEGTPLSATRAQLVLWTLITLALFVAKSLLEGTLWDVPGQLVALMGLSQIGYVAPRVVRALNGPPR